MVKSSSKLVTPSNMVPEQSPTNQLFGNSQEFQQSFGLVWVSITIGVKGGNIPSGYFERVKEMLDKHFVKVSMGLETGGKQKFKHLQIAASTYASSDQKNFFAALRKLIKEVLYVSTGDPLHVCLKEIKPGDEIYVTGYTMKDWGKSTFLHFAKGYSNEELAGCRVRYSRASTALGRNEVSVCPSNVLEQAFTFILMIYLRSLSRR